VHQNDLKYIKKLIFNKKNFKFLWNAVCTVFPNDKSLTYTMFWDFNGYDDDDNDGSDGGNDDDDDDNNNNNNINMNQASFQPLFLFLFLFLFFVRRNRSWPIYFWFSSIYYL